MFPQHLPIFSIPLFDTRHTDKPAFVIDVVPARWDSRVAFDDAVLTFVGEFWSANRGAGEWFDRENKANTVAYYGHQHPDFTVEPGGVMVHSSAPLAQAEPLHSTTDGVALPNGMVLAHDRFGNGATYHHPGFGREKDDLDRFKTRKDDPFAHAARSAVLGVCMATIAARSPYHVRGMEDTITVVADVLARSLACVTATGLQASARLRTEMQDFQRFLARTWVVRPNVGWNAERWVPGSDWEACVAAADAVVLDAARAATVFLGQAHNPISLFAASQTTDLSAHQKLSIKAERKVLERTVHHALAPMAHALKPKAAAAARALLAA